MNNKKNKISFSQNLIRLRKERGLSQQELAKISGLSQRMIFYYENRATNPPIDKVEAIAKALNVNITDLIETKESNKIQEKFSQLDIKTLKKLDLILSLSKHDRHILYLMAETFYKRSKKNKQLTEYIK